jgi:hypothetical protein
MTRYSYMAPLAEVQYSLLHAYYLFKFKGLDIMPKNK